MRRAIAVLTLSLAVAACGRNPTPGTRSAADVLTRQELIDSNVDNAYDAISKLRPMFLRPHRSGGGGEDSFAVVYVDGIRRGPLEVLRGIAVGSVAQIRYLTSAAATTRYGLNVEGGVIQVTSTAR
jgi:hypothetical protein